MATSKHPGKEARAFHLAEVARMYLSGMPKIRIAEARKVAPSQISYDMKALHKMWVESAAVDFNAMRGQQLQRLDMMEDELWKAWQDSQEEAVETFTATETVAGVAAAPTVQNPTPVPPQIPARNRASVKRKQRTGNPDYMALILNVCQERSKLCGLYPKDKDDLIAASGGLQMQLLQRIVIEHEAAGEPVALDTGIEVGYRMGEDGA